MASSEKGSRSLYGVVIVLMFLGGYFLFSGAAERKEEKQRGLAHHNHHHKHDHIDGEKPNRKLTKKKKVIRKIASTVKAKVPLKKMASLLAQSASDTSLENLVSELQKESQDPFITRQANEYTGEMYIVRTKKPLQGTRYFHAQFFKNQDSQKGFVQHMSFEFEKGKDSMDQVVAALNGAFTNLNNPSQYGDSFISWPVGNNYVLWVKKMDVDDISGNPFNAYSKEDIGTIRVALELKVHEG